MRDRLNFSDNAKAKLNALLVTLAPRDHNLFYQRLSNNLCQIMKSNNYLHKSYRIAIDERSIDNISKITVYIKVHNLHNKETIDIIDISFE